MIKFRVPTLSLAVAMVALSNWSYIDDVIDRVIAERNRLSKELRSLGLEVYPNYTNFILVKSNVVDMVDKLRSKGIYVKDISDQLGEGYMRITVGDEEANNMLLKYMEELMI